jgi:peptide/nickel transport system ATP-binding protein
MKNVPDSDGQLLRVQNLSVAFPRKRGPDVVVVDDVSFSLGQNEYVGLVGESGSGKTVTALAVMGLTHAPGKVTSGEVWFKGLDLRTLGEDELRAVRGDQISMIFQSLRSSLNPLMKVGDQVARVYRIHHGLDQKQARSAAIEMLHSVGIPDAKRRAEDYPHQLSGGMCQRVMIAMMISCQPDFLIADEPTTGLDVTIQAQIFELIRDLQRQLKSSVLLITHDLGVVAETCQRVLVMHAGHIVEMADVETIFADSKHPYTKHLMSSILRIDKEIVFPEDMRTISEDILYVPQGCRFAHKCDQAVEGRCFQDKPSLMEIGGGHWVMCHLYREQK